MDCAEVSALPAEQQAAWYAAYQWVICQDLPCGWDLRPDFPDWVATEATKEAPADAFGRWLKVLDAVEVRIWSDATGKLGFAFYAPRGSDPEASQHAQAARKWGDPIRIEVTEP